MKKLLFISGLIALLSCNVSVEEKNDKDSADIDLDKVENKMEQWGDSAKEEYRDIKKDVKDKLDKDSIK